MTEKNKDVTPTTERTFTEAEVVEITAKAMKQVQAEESAKRKTEIEDQVKSIRDTLKTELRGEVLEEAKEEVRRTVNPFSITGKAVEDKPDTEVVLGRIVRSHIVSRMEGKAPIDVARNWSKERPTSSDAMVLRIMETQTNTSGGFIKLPAEVFEEIIPLLEAEAAACPGR